MSHDQDKKCLDDSVWLTHRAQQRVGGALSPSGAG